MSTEQKKLCTGCNLALPLNRFPVAHEDFPTRDGHNFRCFDCPTNYRLVRDPITKKVRSAEEKT